MRKCRTDQGGIFIWENRRRMVSCIIRKTDTDAESASVLCGRNQTRVGKTDKFR